jgi:hypothetical protein
MTRPATAIPAETKSATSIPWVNAIGGLLISAAVMLLAARTRWHCEPGLFGLTGPPPSEGADPWPLPSHPMSLVQQAGLTPATHELFTYHVQAHLGVFVKGHDLVVPGGIGIDIADPAVSRFDVEGAPAYRAGRPPAGVCPRPCISPLHKHDVTGVIHI